jgi:hypothetical protein
VEGIGEGEGESEACKSRNGQRVTDRWKRLKGKPIDNNTTD